MKKGFTLVELIVVVGIIALIASLTLISFPSFRGRLSVDREVGKIALALRKAQQYSGAVKRFNGETFTDGSFPAACGKLYFAQYPAYGLSISMDSPNEYNIYADPDCDKHSISYSGDLVEAITLDPGINIQDICLDIDSAIPTCGITKLDVWFVRPNPTLILRINEEEANELLQSAKIIIHSESGSQKSVIIRKTGQISVQNEP
ncbi:MAG: type II secretion system protein [Patescibacteria group bacterium]